jgi:GDP-L-fucose synthase
MNMKLTAPIFVAGHRGMVGSSIVRALERAGCANLILRTRQQLDLRDQQAVRAFYAEHRPHFVFIAAARVGGIMANNTYPVEFLADNLRIQNNLIEAAYEFNTEKLPRQLMHLPKARTPTTPRRFSAHRAA